MVLDPPVLINNATDRGSARWFAGPFEIGAALYLVSIETTPVTGIHVWKSLDDGNTWTLKDSGNQPTADAVGGTYNVVLVGTTFFVTPITNTDFGMQTFDTLTDTWGAFVASGYTIAPTGASLCVALSDGTVYVFYQKPDTSLKFTTFAAGTFGPEVVFAAAGGQALQCLLADALDVIHVFWSVVTGVTSFNHSTVTAGVVGAPQLIHSHSPFVGFGASNAWIWQGTKMAVPARNDTRRTAGVWISDAVSATPVWTFTLVDAIDWPGLGFLNEQDEDTIVFVDGTTLYVFWTATDYDDPLNILDRLYYVSNDGSGWSDATLFYDAVANPELDSPVAPEDQIIHISNITKLTNGLFGAFIALEEGSFCAPYYLLDAACDIVITIRVGSGALITVPDNGEPFALPPGVSGVPYGPVTIEGSEAGATVFEYSVTAGAPPPGITIGKHPTPADPTPTEESTDGVPVQGVPTTTSWTGPVTTIWTHKVHLIQ